MLIKSIRYNRYSTLNWRDWVLWLNTKKKKIIIIATRFHGVVQHFAFREHQMVFFISTSYMKIFAFSCMIERRVNYTLDLYYSVGFREFSERYTQFHMLWVDESLLFSHNSTHEPFSLPKTSFDSNTKSSRNVVDKTNMRGRKISCKNFLLLIYC